MKGFHMKNVKEKLLTILLTFCMLIGLAPTGTHAADPSVSYKAAWNEDGTAISLTVESAAAGTVYYTVQEATEPDPVYIAANEAVCSAGMNTFTIAQSTQTAKNIYLSYEDSDGNQYSNAKMELGAYWTGTEVTGEPSGVIEKGTVTIEGSRLSADSISLTATSTEDGNLYYIVKPSSEDANNAPIGSADCTFPFQRCGRECLLGDKDYHVPRV